MKKLAPAFLILLSFGCSKNELPSCGLNSVELTIDNETFCTTSHECLTASWKTSSPCGNDGKSNKLLIYVIFSDLIIKEIDFDPYTTLKLEIKDFVGIGSFEVFVNKVDRQGSYLQDRDGNNLIESGTLEVTKLSDGNLSGNAVLDLNINGVTKKAQARLYKVKLD
ncbi:hypothetical protein [Jiulongibacter sediminis]|jgi:hypothetical protein|uniref:hypothetical protein n=1 Tax=Jiulongibacter sediminis TaxID=1605367 RepID=UPI0026ECC9D3|nr:hypothetical protein [Jiulongibacter sediminis]